MELLEFPEEVFVSKIAIQKKYFLSTCVWMFVRIEMACGHRDVQLFTFLRVFRVRPHWPLNCNSLPYYKAWWRSKYFCILHFQMMYFICDLPVNRLVSPCWLCLVYTSSSGCWTITRQQKEWAFPEALYTTTTCDTVRNTNWTQSMLLLLEN